MICTTNLPRCLILPDECPVLYAQKIQSIDGRYEFQEILLRLYKNRLSVRSADLESLPPDEATALDRWLLNQALQLPKSKHYSLNIAAHTLNDEAFVRSLEAHSPENLTLEITEHFPTREYPLLDRIHVSLLLDDAGKDYSNIDRMMAIPFAGIKLDGRIVLRMMECDRAKAAVRFLFMMAAELKQYCVAEYVESAEILEALRSIHQESAPDLELWVQGYHIGYPSFLGEVSSHAGSQI